MKKILLMMVLLTPMLVSGQVFKCIENGKTVYSQQPCSTDTSKSEALIDVARDPATFDIAGVKLGMTDIQAVKAITETLGVSENDIKLIYDPNKYNQYQRERLKNWKGKGYEVKHETGHYLISFWESIDNPQQKIVIGVVYKIKVPETVGMNKIRNDIIKKYGKPSTTNTINGHEMLDWCGALKSNKYDQARCPTFSKKPSLSFFGDVLMLSDGKYTEEIWEEALKNNKR